MKTNKKTKAKATKAVKAPKAAKQAPKKAAPKALKAKVQPPKAARKPAPKAPEKPMEKMPKPSVLRQILEELRAATLVEIKDKVKSGTSATSQEIGDMYDQASEERDRELDLLLGDRERVKLLQIEDAFSRLEEGSYGMCEECGEPINPKRLRIVPFTRTCVDCQTDKEHEERVNRDREQEPEKLYAAATTDSPVSTDEDD